MISKKSLIILILSFLFLGASISLADQALVQKLSDSVRGNVKVSYHAGTKQVRFLAAPPSASLPQPFSLGPDALPEHAAKSFLSVYGRLFGLADPNRELKLNLVHDLPEGRSVVKFKQMHQGLPVIGGEMIVHMDRQKNVRSVNGEVSPDINVDVTPLISAASAESRALARVKMKYGVPDSSLEALPAELSIYNPVLLGDRMNKNFLVWKIIVRSYESPIKEYVFIDAKSGIGLLSFNQIHAFLNRSIYDNENNPYAGLPGYNLARTEGQPDTGDTEVDLAYKHLGDTYNFYWDYHGRDSVDDMGMALIATVRYCEPGYPCPFKNAYWNGEQMVFGKGFAAADDVVGHELTHGVTERESALFYYMQSGAINESLSDIWGEFIDQWNGTGTDTPAVRWLLGEDLPASVGVTRNMKNPPAKGDPDSILSPYYQCSWGDGGGVHTNSGVGNKAAYLLTDGGTFNGYTINSLGLDKVAKIFYQVQTNYLTSGSDYQDLADYLYEACGDLIDTYGIEASDCDEVRKAVNAVHMYALPDKCKNIDPPLCNNGTATDVFFDDMENIESANWTPDFEIWYYPQTPNDYGFDATYATSGQYNIWGFNSPYYTDSFIAMAEGQLLPPSGNIYLQFNHAYEFANGRLCYGSACTPWYPDGGVLEYSIDGGSWSDAEGLMVVNEYDARLDSYPGNPLGRRRAFVGRSRGYIATKLDLSDLADQNVRFRFRIGTSGLGVPFAGWFIDDFRIYTCSNPDPLSMTLTYPSEGQILKPGENETITWTGPSDMAYATLRYSLDKGVTWKTIEKNHTGTDYYWEVPLQQNNKKGIMKVTGYNSKGESLGSSSVPFSIEVVRLIYPNGGDTLTSGDNKNITWTTNTTKAAIAKVLLFYTKNGGTTWKEIDPTVVKTNTGSYDWTVPDVGETLKTKCKAKVVLRDAANNVIGSDVSDSTFTIQPPLP